MAKSHSTGASRRALWSWCIYDWAGQSFATVIQTFVFAAYFTNRIADNPETGTTQWGYTVGLTGLAVALCAPVLGAIADRSGPRKPWLAGFTFLCALGTSLLWFVDPQPEDVPLALGLLAVAVFGAQTATIFYNSMLGDLAPRKEYGRWSGRGWAFGYAGGIACLAAVLFLFTDQEGFPGLDLGPVRATYPFVGVWLVVFTLPILFFAPDRTGDGLAWRKAVGEALSRLRRTLKELPGHRGILRFLVAHALYMDGLATMFALAGVYAAGTFGLDETEILLFGIALNVSAGIGALAFSRIDDRVGSRRTILIALAALSGCTVLALAAPNETWFWVFGVLLGLFVGPVQSSSRSFLSHVAPESIRAQMFGLYALSSRATSFLGPILVGAITAWFGSQSIGMIVIPVLFAIGWTVLKTVPDERE